MARKSKQVELREVEEERRATDSVIRLTQAVTVLPPQSTGPGILPTMPSEFDDHIVLTKEVLAREHYESHTHELGVETLDPEEITLPSVEESWGAHLYQRWRMPLGWLFLGLCLIGYVVYTIREMQAQADAFNTQGIDRKPVSSIGQDLQDAANAAKLVDRINATVKGFFDAQTVDSLAALSRHTSRVKPLMERYYGGKKVPLNRLLRVMQLEPLTIDNRPNFWVLVVELANHETRNLVLEILENGESRVDWETMVCYQPMDWKTYTSERPTSVSMDFRVNVEANDFYSHEFANPKEWESFRLTTRDSGEILYGYAKSGTPEAKEIIENLVANRGRKCSMILRLSIPKGMQSPHAVVIERLLSTRWMYLDPPPE